MKIGLWTILFCGVGVGLALWFLPILTAQLSLNLALVSFKNNAVSPNTFALLEQVDGIESQRSRASWVLGHLYVRENRPQTALEIWAACPEAVDRLVWLGEATNRQRSYGQALSWFDLALSLSPDSAQIWNLKGDTYMAQKDLAEAVPAYQTAVQLGSDNAEYNIDYANGLMAAQLDLDQAEFFLKQALTLAPPTEALYRALATLAISREKLEEAVNWLERASQSPDHSVQTLIDLAILYNQLDNPSAALPYAEQAVHEAPYSTSAQDILSQTRDLLESAP